jgi:hypothetical protein
MIEETLLKGWGATELLVELRRREELRRTMVGQLYPSIVFDEECQIIEEARLRFGCHPNWFKERGLI